MNIFLFTLRVRPHRNALLCKRIFFASFWPIAHTDPVNAATENTLIWNRVSGWKNPKMLPLRFRVDSKSAYFTKQYTPPLDHLPPTSEPLRRLITTTTKADYVLLFVPQKILSLSCNLLALWLSVSRSSNSTSLMVHTNDSSFLALAIFVFIFFLRLVSPSTSVSLQRASFVSMLRLFFFFFWWISSTTYSPGIWTTAFSVVFRGTVWTQIFLKRCQGRRGEKKIVFICVDEP